MDFEYLVSRFAQMQAELDLARHPDEHAAVHAALDRLAVVDGHAALASLRGAPKAAYAYAKSLAARRRRISRGFAATREDFDALGEAFSVLHAHFREEQAAAEGVGAA